MTIVLTQTTVAIIIILIQFFTIKKIIIQFNVFVDLYYLNNYKTISQKLRIQVCLAKSLSK